jgi:hypothetical protein
MTGNFTDGEIQAINRCRLFLQVECLSDICTAEGSTQIQDCKHNRQQLSHRVRSSGLVKGLGRTRGQRGESSSNHIHVIPRAIGYASH